MNVPAKFEVRSFTCSELKGDSQKFGAVPGYTYTHTLYPLKKSYIPTIQTIYLCALVFPRFSIAVLSGVANHQSWGRGGRRGPGMVPFERALVSSYRLSIVTFSLSLRVSEILPLLFSSTPLFPYHTSTLPIISPCPPEIGGSPFCCKERMCWANCPRN